MKDEETRRQLAAREDVLKDRQRAKAKAIEQRGEEAAEEDPIVNTISIPTPVLSFSKEPTEIEELADEAMRRHGDLAIAEEMPGSKYDEDEGNEEDESAIMEDILSIPGCTKNTLFLTTVTTWKLTSLSRKRTTL